MDPQAQYRKAKQCLRLVEDQGIFSMRVLQATLLLSLYEAGHAIFPAAFLSIGHCARIGHAIGIHDRRGVSQMFPSTSDLWPTSPSLKLVINAPQCRGLQPRRYVARGGV